MKKRFTKRYITLIGMSGVGKTTLGRAVAKRFGLEFADTDAWLEGEIGDRQSFLDTYGAKAYLNKERETICSLLEELDASYVFSPGAIIATGGSVIYRETAMIVLSAKTHMVYLHDTPERIAARRAPTAHKSGIIGLREGMTLEDLARERQKMYESYAFPHIVSLSHTSSILEAEENLVAFLENTGLI